MQAPAEAATSLQAPGPERLLRALLLFGLGVGISYLSLSEFVLALSYESEAPPVAHYATPLRQIVFGGAAYAIAFVAFRGSIAKSRVLTSIVVALCLWVGVETTRQVSRDQVLLGPASLERFNHKSCGPLKASFTRVSLGPNQARFYLPLPVASERLARDVQQFSCKDTTFTQGARDG